MISLKDIIDRYIKNIELWEKVSNLTKGEKDFIAGQRHACEQILECVEKDEIPMWWPAE